MIVSLGMYPFPHVRGAQDRLWAALRDRLPGAPEAIDRETELHEAWHRPDLLLGQTCGWPLVTELDGGVEVVGTFDVDVPFATAGHYRSVLVASLPLSVEEWRRRPGTVSARNNSDSLSGWVSLCAAWGSVPADVVETGSHFESLRAVAGGRAHLAAIDAVTFELVARLEPATVGRVHIVGHCPRIPCLPLVMAPQLAHRRDELRAALAEVVRDPTLAPDLAELRIRGFVPFGREEYEPVRALLPAS